MDALSSLMMLSLSAYNESKNYLFYLSIIAIFYGLTDMTQLTHLFFSF